jgi:hypothetical protein
VRCIECATANQVRRFINFYFQRSCQYCDSDLRSKINDAWNDLPSFLTLPNRELWQRGRSCHEVDILHQVRLFYLQTTFLIEWAAARHGLDQTGMLFANASELLAWVNELLVRREQLFNLSLTSLAWRVCIPNQFASGFYANGKKKGGFRCSSCCWCARLVSPAALFPRRIQATGPFVTTT